MRVLAVPDLHFHGHARLSQVDCVANQALCAKQMVRAYPTVRMYKDGDPVHFELFTGERTDTALLKFIQEQMATYKVCHNPTEASGAWETASPSDGLSGSLACGQVVTKLLKHANEALPDLLAYKYTVHSNVYDAKDASGSRDAEPSIDFKYDLSPISIVVQQERIPTYKFITSSCAIIGGVFTVIGLLENVLHVTHQSLSKKQI